MKIMGIYQIKNKSTSKIYIGSARHINLRWNGHRKLLNKNNHPNAHLQNAWNLYGKDDFEWSILEIIKEEKDLIIQEQKWIDLYQCYLRINGYNIRINAKSNLGLKYSEEFRKNKSIKMIGNKFALGNKGRVYTKEQLEFAKERMIGSKNPMYGKTHSIEQKINLSKRSKGNQYLKGHKHTGEKLLKFKKSPEHRKKLSEIKKTWWLNKKNDEKISQTIQ
jgi:group I intron endonuclease